MAALPEMGIHFRQAAAVCKMTYRGDFDDIRKATRSLHISQSIADDDSDVNVECLCWILYCSTNTVHKKVFGMEMNDHYEILLMRQLGLYYRDDDKGVKGCVSKYYNKMLNEYRTGVRDGLTSVASCTIVKVQRLQLDVLFRHFEREGSIPRSSSNLVDAILNHGRQSDGAPPRHIESVFRNPPMNCLRHNQYEVEKQAHQVHGVAACQEVTVVTNNRSVVDKSVLGFGSLHNSFDIDYENDGLPTVSNNCGWVRVED